MLSDGDDTSSLIEYDEVLDLAKRSETAIYAIGLRQQEHRPARVQGSGVRAAAAVAGDRRPRVLPDRRRASCRRSTSRSRTSSPASTRIAYSSKNPMRNGAWRRIVVRVDSARADARGRGRATTARRRPLDRMHLLPLAALRRRGCGLRRRTSRWRDPRVGPARDGAARRRRARAHLSHRHADRAGRARAARRHDARRSRRSSGCSGSRTSTSS